MLLRALTLLVLLLTPAAARAEVALAPADRSVRPGEAFEVLALVPAEEPCGLAVDRARTQLPAGDGAVAIRGRVASLKLTPAGT